MAIFTLRTLSGPTQRALKARAAASGRTVEAEIVEIVEMAVRGKSGGGMSAFDFTDILREYSVGPKEPPAGS